MLSKFIKRSIHSLKELELTVNDTKLGDKWLKRCLLVGEQYQTQKKPLKPVADLLGLWFEKYVYFTGESQVIKAPIYNPTIDELESISKILLLSENLSSHAKVINLQLQLYKSNGNWGKIGKLRQETRLDKFKIYHNNLGCLKVIENGMFHKFTFHKNTRYSLADFDFLCQSLAVKLANSSLSLPFLVLLIEQMHGFHIKEFGQKYHKGLSPDIQLARIYKSTISKSHTPHPDLIKEYNELIQNIDASQTKENTPKSQSEGQRLKSIENQNLKFGRMPLNIVLSAICILLKSNNFKSQFTASELSFRLLATMVKKRSVHPNQDTLCCLITIFHDNDQLKHEIPKLIETFKRYCSPNRSVFTTLESLGYDRAGNLVA